MAFALEALTAQETASFNADKPMLVSPNRLLPTHTSKWSLTPAATDDTDPDKPSSRLCDDFTHLKSSHLTTGDLSFISFDFGATGITFDTVALFNLTSNATNPSAFGIEISDVSDFSSFTALYGVLETTVVSRHIAILSQRATSARYVRIVFGRFGDTPMIRSVGEVIFGQRCQLDWRPVVPWDDQSLASPIVRSTRTITGIKRTVSLGPTGQRRIRASLGVDNATTQANLRDWWKDGVDEGRPFLWIDNPSTAPNRGVLMHQNEAAFNFPYVEALNREFVLDAEEQGPNFIASEA